MSKWKNKKGDCELTILKIDTVHKAFRIAAMLQDETNTLRFSSYIIELKITKSEQVIPNYSVKQLNAHYLKCVRYLKEVNHYK